MVWGVSLAALGFLVSTAASAAVITSTTGFQEQNLGAGVATFESPTPVNTGGTTNPPGQFSDGPGSWSGTGIIANGTSEGNYAAPAGDTTDYMAVLASPNRGPETLTLTAPATTINLYWGSIDTYNFIDFLIGTTVVKTVSGSFFAPANGDQVAPGTNRFVTITLASIFNGVRFRSEGLNAFEFDNVSANAVPIPAALPLFAGGVGLLGWLARRKRRSAVAALNA